MERQRETQIVKEKQRVSKRSREGQIDETRQRDTY